MALIIFATIDGFAFDEVVVGHSRHFEKPYCEKREDFASSKDSWRGQDRTDAMGF